MNYIWDVSYEGTAGSSVERWTFLRREGDVYTRVP